MPLEGFFLNSPMPSQERPVIFLACADSTAEGKALPNLQMERVYIEKFFQTLINLNHCELISHAHASGQGFFDIVKNENYKKGIQLIHFAGHADDAFLRFISPKGVEEKKSVEELCQDIKGMEALKLVFLNGCATKNFVTSLLEAGVPAVLATYRKIKDKEALTFAQAFYEGMVVHAQSIQHAYLRAKRVLIETHQITEDLLGISKASEKNGQVQISDEVIYRKSKSRKSQQDAQSREEEEQKEFTWKLWHKEDNSSILQWAFNTRENLGLNSASEQEVRKQLDHLKKKLETLRQKQASMIEADKIRLDKQRQLTEEIDRIQTRISNKEKTKEDALVWKETMDELLAEIDKQRSERDQLSGRQKIEAMRALKEKTKEQEDLEADQDYQEAIQIIAAIDREIAPLQQRLEDIEIELQKLSEVANREVLQQELLGLNFRPQRLAYKGKQGGLQDSYLNLIHLQGAKEYGVDILMRVIREKWSFPFEQIPKSLILNFGANVSEDKLPNKDNIWHMTYDALFSKKGENNKSLSSGKELSLVEGEVCNELIRQLEASPVVIRWDHVQEARISGELIGIANEFWKKLIHTFPSSPPKHHLYLFLIDRLEEEEMEELLISEHPCIPHDKVYNHAKYFQNRTSFYPLPLIGPVSRDEIVDWFSDLEVKQDFQVSRLHEISSEHDFFVEANNPQPIEIVIQDICEAFDFNDIANNLLNHA